MDLLFLGTSAGVPTRARNVTGLAVLDEVGKGWYLIDCGEGTQHRLLRTRLSLHDLRAVFITHVHGDHCFGLPGLLASAAMQGRREALDIIAPSGIETLVRTSLRVSDSHLPYDLRFIPVETFVHWQSANVIVEAFALSHRVPCHAYRFTERNPQPRLDIARLEREGVPRGPLWGLLARGQDVAHEGRRLCADDYRLAGRAPRRLIVAGDNDRPELLQEACEGICVLVHEATYTQAVLDTAKANHGHSSAATVARFAARAGVPNLVLTHFSARYQADPSNGTSIEDIRVEAQQYYAGTLFLAEDLMRLHLGRDGRLIRV